MTDPIAEAAAAQQAANEPSLLEKAQETIHQLEEKLEHMIHPVEDAAPSSTEPVQEVSAAVVGEPQMPSSGPAEGGPESLPASSESVETPQSSSSPADAGAVGGESIPNAAPTPPAGDATAVAGDVPNAAASPVVAASESVTSSSVSPVLPASATPDPSASVAIREHLQTIRSHLSLMGFEQSSVAVIHGAMAEIEKLL